MNHLDALHEHAAAFRAAALRAGADRPVPTCPAWDVRDLIRHLARVYRMVLLGLELGPEDERPKTPSIPKDFESALATWDGNLAELLDKLSTVDPDKPTWAFFPGSTPRMWTRRQAHETAIHRLDAELACAEPNTDLLFDPELAADGIDEMLTVLQPLRDWSDQTVTGRVLYHAADAGRAWLVTFSPHEPPKVDTPTGAALGKSEVDATVAGTADAVYRRVWSRPSTAVVTGDTTLAEVIRGT